MLAKLRRLRARWIIWRGTNDSLNRRAAVEQYLFNAAAGKSPLPDANKCRELAIRLGVPSEFKPKPTRPVEETSTRPALKSVK